MERDQGDVGYKLIRSEVVMEVIGIAGGFYPW